MTVMQIFGLKGIEEFSSNLHYLVNILSRKFNTFPSGLLVIFCFLKRNQTVKTFTTDTDFFFVVKVPLFSLQKPEATLNFLLNCQGRRNFDFFFLYYMMITSSKKGWGHHWEREKILLSWQFPWKNGMSVCSSARKDFLEWKSFTLIHAWLQNIEKNCRLAFFTILLILRRIHQNSGKTSCSTLCWKILEKSHWSLKDLVIIWQHLMRFL